MDTFWERALPEGATAIVVEDNELVSQLVFNIIEELGAICVCFRTADEALAYLCLAKGKCSLTVIDHGLPGSLQGTKFLCLMKENWPSIPAILMSGYEIENPFPDEVVYLQKPWSAETFIEAVCKLLKDNRSGV